MKFLTLIYGAIISFLAGEVPSGFGVNGILRQQECGACAELTAFRTATEYLSDYIGRSPRLGRAMFFRNLVPKGIFTQNTGVTHSTFNIKSSEPTDDNSLFQQVTLVGGLPSPTCDTNYEDIGVGFFERTYGPKKRRFRGPVICKEQLQFLHNPGGFITGYMDEMGLYMSRVFEFAFRSDLMAFGDWFSNGTKTSGPNAIATVGIPSQGLSQGMLDDVAVDLNNTGAGVPDGRGYVEDGNAGPIYPLYIDAVDSRNIMQANATTRDDLRYASMGKDGEGNFALWKAIGSTRTIGNFRHVPTFIAPRFNFTGGVLVPVAPFKDITAVGTDQEILTTAYKNAVYGAALVALPSTMTAEVVKPATAGLNWDANNDYNGEFTFLTGGERICNPAEYDPEHHKGRHFANIFYAPKPGRIHDTKVVVYKRCAQTTDTRIFCS